MRVLLPLVFFSAILSAQTAKLLTELIRVDTSNPPGNESKLDELLAAKLRPLGFTIEMFPTPVAGKTHMIARLKGDGSARPVLIASHADVVGVERDKWTVDPFAGVVKDGYVYGRGAIDFKGGIAVFAEAVMRLARNHVPLKRDVIFMIEADEEAQPYNTSWLAREHWDKMDCEFALNEGGWIIKRDNGTVRYVSISTADKTSISLVLTAHGTSTHSSLPRNDQAISRLSKAMARLADYDTKPEFTASTREFFLTLAKTADPPMSNYLYNLVTSQDPKVIAEADRAVSKDVLLHAIMRNTIAPVLMNAGFRSNVIPGSAEATINFRTIPGTTAADLAAEIKRVIADPNIEIAPVRSGIEQPHSKDSSTETALYQALKSSANTVWPGVPVTPYLFQAGTDASAWRTRGVPVYGIYPYPISNDDLSRMHGNDERVPVASLEQGTELIYQTLLKVAAK
jgi:acetylornithine deacetylase/succinyl-diaminopimelate desuccinylase-like protein